MLHKSLLALAAVLVFPAVQFSLAQARGQGQPAMRPDPHRIDEFLCDWHESMPHQTHGGMTERDILTPGDAQTSTKRCAVLSHANHVSYGTLTARGAIAPMKLQGEQEVLYVVSGKGTITSGGQTSDLFDGMAVFTPAGVEFSMKNTGDEDLNMYIINETTPADFKPATKLVLKDMNLTPVQSTTGHWVHIVKNLFTPADGMATGRTLIVAVDPMTVPEPHAHTVGSEELWIQVKGKSLLFLGTQLRWQTAGMGYLAPPFAEQTKENVTAGLSFPHSNINPGTEQVKFLYFQAQGAGRGRGQAQAQAPPQ